MIEVWMTPEVVQRLAGSLLHFVWQGALIAMIAAVALRLLADRSAESRYTVSVAALLLMLAAPLVTFAFYTETGRATLALLQYINDSVGATASVAQAATTIAWTQWIVLLWFIGVLMCSIRLLAGWRLSRSLTRVGISEVPSEIQQSFNEIMERLALTKPVRLLVSIRIDTPVAVGWLRPFVLLPITALTGLDEHQLRAVLAHELAHIRRHDFLVNMIQRGVESVLFYHPAVWWLSARIRSEREHCCDDLAVEICGDRSVYAEALIELERVRTVEPELALSATGGRLTQRIYRVLGFKIVEHDGQSAIAALLFVIVWVIVGVWQSDRSLNAKPIAPPPVPPPVVMKSATMSAIAAIVTAEPVQLPIQPPVVPQQLGNVRGRVVDMATGEGRRIEKLLICCDYSKPVYLPRDPQVPGPRRGTPFTSTISDDGSFAFSFVPPGNYQLSTEDPSIVPVSWALAVGQNGAPALQLEVTDGVEVQGTVLDQNGSPVSASVDLRFKPADAVFNTISPPMSTGHRLNQAQPDIMWGILIPRARPPLDALWDRILSATRTRVRSAMPEPDGRFTFRGVHPGTYVLEVKTGGVAIPSREIQVGLAGLTNVSFQAPAIQVTGRVIAPRDGPLPKLNYVRLVRSADSEVFYGHADPEGNFSLVLLPGNYRVFTERLGPSVQAVSYGSRDITNTEFTLEAGRNPQIVVTLQP
jgi:beta-lactamase regulating signal transducer with metallopeptidase domain